MGVRLVVNQLGGDEVVDLCGINVNTQETPQQYPKQLTLYCMTKATGRATVSNRVYTRVVMSAHHVLKTKLPAEGEVLERVEERLGLLGDFLELGRAVDLRHVLLEGLDRSYIL